ncbi:hypothetical protein BT96DRAFT_969229 [Gymnopus androsaceus JB14]|uniref:SH3 domain-containing protein n=1 Tax=Gymnopus androsaceus JB14 TaxID=1447944 RepID=A0A6A4IQD6_9AGAR|nr:hypothetical protein BT96DRAFT_969229 [Gymnopus androsaceus JB14]
MSHAHLGRRAAVFREMKRTPQADASAAAAASAAGVSLTTPTATSTPNAGQELMASLPTSTIALAVVLSVLGAVIIGICAWKYRARRRRQRQSADTEWDDPLYRAATNTTVGSEKQVPLGSVGSVVIDKPQQVFIPIPHKGEAAWTPQVRAYNGVPLHNGELPKHVQAAREGRKFITSWREPAQASPPPSYREKVDLASDAATKPPTAPINKQLNVAVASEFPTSRFSNPTPLPLSAVDEHPEPLPSPARSSSFAQQQRHSRSRSVSSKHISGEVVTKTTPSMVRHHSRSSSITGQIRLMAVINTFHPSLADELPITIGDCVRLIEEYHDGWCLVQRVGKADAPRGVVPRFCLVDRPSAGTKSTKSRKRSLTQSAVKA